MREVINFSVAGLVMQALVWPIEDVKWIGEQITCPHCQQRTKVDAKADVIQYGLIDLDLVWTIFACHECGDKFAVRYTLEYSDAEGQNG